MAAPFPKGTRVRQVLPPPEEGIVTKFDVDQISGDRQYLVEWPDAKDPTVIHSGFYSESELEKVEDAVLAPAPTPSPTQAPDPGVADTTAAPSTPQ